MSKSNRNQPQSRQQKKQDMTDILSSADEQLGQLGHVASSDDANHVGEFVGFDQSDLSDQKPDFTSWQSPKMPEGENFFANEPALFGAQIQQGNLSFQAQGDDAPTRIGKPITAQMVSKRVSASNPDPLARVKAVVNEEIPAAAEPQETKAAEAPAPQRRRSRMDRNRQQEAQEIQPVAAPAVVVPAANQENDFDLFGAGDSEVPAKPQHSRRAATPDGRYTGARTAMPSGGAAQSSVAQRARETRDQVIAEQQAQTGAQETAQTEQKQPVARPAAQKPRQRPAAQAQNPTGERTQSERPKGQRPAAANQRQRPQAQTTQTQPPQARRPQQRPQAQQPSSEVRQPQFAPSASQYSDQAEDIAYKRNGFEMDEDTNFENSAPVNKLRRKQVPSTTTPRDRYDFEDDDDDDDDDDRGGNILVPIIITILAVGVLLASICLPDWDGIGGTVGETMSKAKNGIVSVFSSVKNMIVPEEELVKSFSATASEGQAPTEVVFAIQTSKNVTDLRIVNDSGVVVYEGMYSQSKEESGEIISNSNVYLWKPALTITEAYHGGFTVYAHDKDGDESDGIRCTETIVITEPQQQQAPIDSFEVDNESGEIPLTIRFTVTSSSDVTAVRVVDENDTPIATMYYSDISDEFAQVEDNGDYRIWTLAADIESAYAGEYQVHYQSGYDAQSFEMSGYTVMVNLAEEIVATAEPTPEISATPSPSPSPSPTPSPTPEPTATPIPATTALPSADALSVEDTDPSKIKLAATLYKNGSKMKTFARTKTISMLAPFTTSIDGDDYAIWKQAGVLTFRNGPFRQNASYSTAEVEKQKLTQVWTQPIGSMQVDSGTYFGVGNPGQAVIVKWATEVRESMGLNDTAKSTKALKEVIVAAMDGYIYFYNLVDGTATREPIELGAPSFGGLSVATNGTPILGVGQYNSKLVKKTISNGYHIINLISNEKEMLIANDGKDKSSNYTGVLGSALFDKTTGTMVFGGMNGVVYSAELGAVTKAYNHEAGTISLGSEVQAYKTLAGKQDKRRTNIDGSVAMYNNYVYYGDKDGILQCVDINTLTAVWAVNTKNTIISTPALDMSENGDVSLYTANILHSKGGVSSIRRFDALTGELAWQYEIPELKYNSKQERGVYASPVIGNESISDLVIYTVSKDDEGSTVLALNKDSGTVVWSTDFETTTQSSPVAVYNEAGDAWLIQAESNGNINLMDAKSGKVLDSLKLEAEIEASPAVYGNLMIIGTTGKDTGGVYCIRID
ncbi:MAG: PQQ-binding-like beta-propeller repeat protein [Clostridiales bacterium]|nr:PQQ-binding-like beta-propeller repeat protein [Clostridiales bacterium]